MKTLFANDLGKMQQVIKTRNTFPLYLQPTDALVMRNINVFNNLYVQVQVLRSTKAKSFIICSFGNIVLQNGTGYSAERLDLNHSDIGNMIIVVKLRKQSYASFMFSLHIV